jgi:hypothetical protein
MHLISASRRTDIPAFYSPWFLERIRAERVSWTNPYSGKLSTVSLAPAEVAAILFWTRNFAPMFRHLPELEERGHRYLVHFTLTHLPRRYESHVPPPKAAVAQFRRISQRIGPDRILWRYDPILISPGTGPEYHLREFESLAAALEGATRQCSISFVQIYGKVRRNFARQGLPLPAVDPELRRELASRLGEIGAEKGIAVKACCSDDLVGPGVGKARCVDGEQILRLWPGLDVGAGPAPTRDECGCFRSFDVGAYDSCPHGCLYCYANRDRETAAARRRQHDPHRESLFPPGAGSAEASGPEGE